MRGRKPTRSDDMQGQPKSAVNWWLRSAGSAEQMRYVNNGGNVNSNNASNTNCPRPALTDTLELKPVKRRLPLKKRYI